MRANIYIRKENEEEWASIKDKSDWVNSRLGVSAVPAEPITPEVRLEAITEIARQQNNPRFSGAIKSCKIHHIPLTPYGKCLQKGCKYS